MLSHFPNQHLVPGPQEWPQEPGDDGEDREKANRSVGLNFAGPRTDQRTPCRVGLTDRQQTRSHVCWVPHCGLAANPSAKLIATSTTTDMEKDDEVTKEDHPRIETADWAHNQTRARDCTSCTQAARSPQSS